MAQHTVSVHKNHEHSYLVGMMLDNVGVEFTVHYCSQDDPDAVVKAVMDAAEDIVKEIQGRRDAAQASD